jgi:hypothetical protein
MRTPRWPLASLIACTLPTACAQPCVDDGLGQADCPSEVSETDTASATASNSNTDTVTATMGTVTVADTEVMSGSQTADGTETDGDTLWCVDADGDGFGDPDMCTQGGDMPPGTVDNDLDCDDTNPNTFPGAAELEDPRACMQDDDDDGWGDSDPPPGVVPGTDCADDNPFAFPGAAHLEDPRACMQDADGDGWGDANPGGGGGGGGGPVAGSDCYDSNPLLNPDTVQLTAFTPYQGGPGAPRNIQRVNNDASLDPFLLLLTPMGGIPNVNIVTATFNEDMQIFANDLTSVQLQSIEYPESCPDFPGVLSPVGMPYAGAGHIVCGLEFGSDGQLYGISHTADDLRTFDTTTGEVLSAVPITIGPAFVDVFSCGMARDCTEGRLLLANGVDRTIYGIDEQTGVAEVIRDLSAFFPSTWTPTGLEYDPVTRSALLSTGTQLYRIDLTDDSIEPELLGGFGTQVSNLQYLPVCM